MGELTVCPRCATPLVVEAGEAPWCERCEWGLDAVAPAGSRLLRPLRRSASRLGFRRTMAVYRHVERSRGSGTWGWSRVAVLGLSLVVLGLTLGLVVLAVWLVVRYPTPFTVVAALLLLVIAAILLPRPVWLPARVERVPRSEAPALYGLVDRAAAGLGVRGPDLIVVSDGFGGSSARIGLRRRRVLHLGLAWWASLAPPQRVALLGHALTPDDVREGLLADPALRALGRLADLCEPVPARRSNLDPMRMVVMPSSPERMSVLSEGIGRVFMRPVAMMLRAAQAGLLVVAMPDGQRAGYRADRGAARLAGTGAAVDLVELDLQPGAVEAVIASSVRAGRGAPGWREAVAELHERQVPRRIRLRQRSIRHEASLWADHPPAGLRARLLEAVPRNEPVLVLSEAESDRIDAELASRYERCRRTIAQLH